VHAHGTRPGQLAAAAVADVKAVARLGHQGRGGRAEQLRIGLARPLHAGEHGRIHQRGQWQPRPGIRQLGRAVREQPDLQAPLAQRPDHSQCFGPEREHRLLYLAAHDARLV
jgi:hypothetical protein